MPQSVHLAKVKIPCKISLENLRIPIAESKNEAGLYKSSPLASDIKSHQSAKVKIFTVPFSSEISTFYIYQCLSFLLHPSSQPNKREQKD